MTLKNNSLVAILVVLIGSACANQNDNMKLVAGVSDVDSKQRFVFSRNDSRLRIQVFDRHHLSRVLRDVEILLSAKEIEFLDSLSEAKAKKPPFPPPGPIFELDFSDVKGVGGAKKSVRKYYDWETGRIFSDRLQEILDRAKK